MPSPSPRALLLAVLLAAGCGDGALGVRGDEGTIRVRVTDDRAAPVAGAGVRVQMQNASGGLFEVGSTTHADGTWTISAVPEGARRVTVTPPAGYAAGPEPLVRTVAVVRGQTVQADFVLQRLAAAGR